ncbi:GNAT family N-acetyltransferase [Pontibacter sp. JH31]|uniref:GNAT family N-acetyltransferase n=1 Tax=Pontibacter aquaedesilientis TaxID=2766980 RepID=A0ABR7XFQ9_9BACT|nr:GNAT family N-acetyltransferase [Pontibacter aquaedesilientis]MBD1397112.1 GNAT family N-acetyltransferase [Pontibacter aquaedesilientis]
MALTKICKAFGEMTPHEMYDMLRLRSEVFVVEQNCVFPDMDDKDQLCHHILLYNEEQVLVATARLVPTGVSYPDMMSIGRIVTSQLVRGTGVGKELVEMAIQECYRLFGQTNIRIGAQLYAKKFYERFGFEQSSEVYDEDGIDHIKMVKQV